MKLLRKQCNKKGVEILKNVLLTIIALVLLGGLGFGIFAYFDTKNNLETKNENEKLQTKDKKDTDKSNNDISSDSKGNNNNESSTGNEAPSLDEMIAMINEGKDVNGIVDKLGNKWSTNPGISVTYTNPQGESYTAGTGGSSDISGADFNRSYDENDSPIEYAEEPDPEVIKELQNEIDNAGLQSEMEAKQKELDDYINSFPE